MMTRISKLTSNARESTGARTDLEVAVVLAERTDLLELLEAAVEAATIPPTNDAVRAAAADAKMSIPKDRHRGLLVRAGRRPRRNQ